MENQKCPICKDRGVVFIYHPFDITEAVPCPNNCLASKDMHFQDEAEEEEAA